MNFLTVEDVDGAIERMKSESIYHVIDTRNISTTEDFSDVVYDFVKVSRTTAAKQHTFSFEIHNMYWTGSYFGVVDGGYVTSMYPTTFDSETNTLTINVASSDWIVLTLFLHPSFETFNLQINQNMLLEPIKYVTYNQIGTNTTVLLKNLITGDTISAIVPVNIGLNEVTGIGGKYVYTCVLLKTNFQFTCNQNVTIGKTNKVYLGADNKYKPNGSMIGEYTPTITVNYGGQILPVTFDGTDYYFNLDLTDKTSTGKIRFKVLVEANDVLNATETDVVLQSQYQTVNTFENLVAACGDNGNDIIRLGSNLTATSDIPIKHSIKIIGNDKTLDLDSHRFVLDEDVTFNVEYLQLDNGDTTIIQAKNTKVELNNVTFNNCTSSNYNGLGSCIFCDVDVDSLDNTDDYITTLTNCTFTNNSNCILHGGELTIIGCTLSNNDTTNINTNNVAFVYQTDGTCLIQQSTFTINYDTNTLCSGETNIGYAQALVMCGETANINGANHTNLQGDNTLPFFDAPFNNMSNVYAKYYYPQITACVESVTTLNNKGCCHSVSNVDWVFKNNVTVRRVE